MQNRVVKMSFRQLFLTFSFLIIVACKTLPSNQNTELNSDNQKAENSKFAQTYQQTVESTPAPTPIKHLAPIKPNPEWAPGDLCTKVNPDFFEYRYKEKIPYCKRVVTSKTKRELYERYGVPTKCRGGYTIDHIIPLALGGSNDLKNLWPEPKAIKFSREGIEDKLYHLMKSGELKQVVAVEIILKEKKNPNLNRVPKKQWLGYPECE